MKVEFDRGALADMAEILDYIAERNPTAAAELALRFREASALTGEMPEMGTPTSRPKFRRLVVGRYLMVYDVSLGAIVFRYVRHGARLRPWEGE